MGDTGWILFSVVIFWGVLFGIVKTLRWVSAALTPVARALAPVKRGFAALGKSIEALFAGILATVGILLVFAIAAFVIAGIVGVLWFGVRQIL